MNPTQYAAANNVAPSVVHTFGPHPDDEARRFQYYRVGEVTAFREEDIQTLCAKIEEDYPSKQWSGGDIGPRQTKKLNGILRKLSGIGRGTYELNGTEGKPETYSAPVTGHSVIFGWNPVHPGARMAAYALGERHGWNVSKKTYRAVLADAEKTLAEVASGLETWTFDRRISVEEETEQAEKAAKYKREREEREKRDNVTKSAVSECLSRAPKGAKALVVAELRVNDSDSQTDYFASHTCKTVALGYRFSARESFKRLRELAATFDETAHLGPGCDIYTVLANAPEGEDVWDGRYHRSLRDPESSGSLEFRTEEEARAEADRQIAAVPEGYTGIVEFAHYAKDNGYEVNRESVEHRDNYSMGRGNYLQRRGGDSGGWSVRSVSLDYAAGCISGPFEDRTHVEPEAEEPSGAAVESGEYRVQESKNKRGKFFLAIPLARLAREAFMAEKSRAQTIGGWYSRKWGATPGGFGFSSEAEALEFIGGN